MKWKVIAAATIALAATGCQTVQWEKPGATTVDFEADKRQCVYQANLATPGTPSYDMGSAVAAGITDGLRLVELETLCMQARGWAQVAVEQAPQPIPVAAASAPPAVDARTTFGAGAPLQLSTQ